MKGPVRELFFGLRNSNRVLFSNNPIGNVPTRLKCDKKIALKSS